MLAFKHTAYAECKENLNNLLRKKIFKSLTSIANSCGAFLVRMFHRELNYFTSST